MTKAERTGKWLVDKAQKAAESEYEFNRRRFRQDIQRYGKAAPEPQPLPPKKPTTFEPPSKYEERNGG